MCTRYIPPEVAEIERFWGLPRGYQPDLWPREMFPRAPGPFIRRRRDATGYERELVVGRWGLIPERSETSTPRKKDGKLLNTENARGEEVHWKDSYKGPWALGQRCIIPAATFDEPNWETGKNVWWRFRRADGAPWGLAGLWNLWPDPETGELHESYTMLTLNANAHPLMSRMHRPVVDPVTKVPLPLDKQDKRSVIPLEAADFDQWLEGTVQQVKALMRLVQVDVFDAAAVEPTQPPAPELL
ncbi:SOS response-associated peptidase [Variovorax boronicumulans]|uniref:SOS response-associated peptidase n=1 Tax=Variovorax boronicumulans TaxID=436515 RepID=UPI001C594EB0